MIEGGNITRSRRKNGSEASCEPCRRSKLKCDHERPVCGRCRKRALQSKCFYHPAPLTKSRPSVSNADTMLVDNDTQVAVADTSSHPPVASSVRSMPSNNYTPPYTPLSLASIPSVLPRVSTLGKLDTERLSSIANALRTLCHFEAICENIEDYYQDNIVANISSSLILPALQSLTTLVGDATLSNELMGESPDIQHLAYRVACSSGQAISITSATTLHDFTSLHTGINLRLDFLGVIYALAARARVYNGGKIGLHDDLTQTMIRGSELCYSIARELAPMNDVLAWLSLERLLLATNVYGDACEEVWRVVGDVSSDVLALNFNREANITQDCPFFLQECRRKISSRSYAMDVYVSSVMNRPPRLSRRYFDVQNCLDLREEEIVATPEALMAVRSKLSPDGWNVDVTDYFPSSFARLRQPTARLREEAWEQSLDVTSPHCVAKLQELSQRNRQLWDSLPPRLHYTPACWHSPIPGRIGQALLNIQLTFMQTEFQISRSLKRADPTLSLPILTISFELLKILTELGAIRKQAAVYDFSFQSLWNGFPAAVVLLEALYNPAAANSPASPPALPEGATKASLIRLLSVLAHQLKSACEPDRTNYAACMQASEAIGSRLDEIINAPSDAAQRAQTSADGDEPGGGIDGTLADPLLWSDADINNLLKDVDWNNISTEWDL